MGLNKVFLLNRKVAELQTQLLIYRQMAEDVKVSNLQEEVRGAAQTSRTEWLITLITDTEKKISDALNEKDKAVQKLTSILELADLPPDVYTIFFLRYVNCKQWREIAQVINFSERRIFQLHKIWKGKFEE